MEAESWAVAVAVDDRKRRCWSIGLGYVWCGVFGCLRTIFTVPVAFVAERGRCTGIRIALHRVSYRVVSCHIRVRFVSL